MTFKAIVQEQYRAIVGRAAAQARNLAVPPEGWLRTMREALGMSGENLARRAGVGRARISQAEQAELSGGVTLKTMQRMAAAMDCRFVYAIVPATSVDDVVAAQAHRKAAALVTRAGSHMALEDQGLPGARMKKEIERLARDMARDIPPGFWAD